jgi:hypothetical protein
VAAPDDAPAGPHPERSQAGRVVKTLIIRLDDLRPAEWCRSTVSP